MKKRFTPPPRSSNSPAGLVLFGSHAVAAAWLNPKRRCLRLWVTPAASKAFTPHLEQAKRLGLSRPSPEMVEPAALDRHTPPGAVHQGIAVEVQPLEAPDLENLLENAPEQACLVVLDQVTDPHNVGAILRSACAFGALAVLVTEHHAPNTTGTLAKAACGALEHTPIVRLGNLAQAMLKMQKAGFWCIGLAQEGREALHRLTLPPRLALLLGAEGEGLRRLTRDNCDTLAHLPTQAPLPSLNVSNAAALAIYEVMRQRGG